MDRDELARMLAEGLSLEAIGGRVGKHASTVGYWVQKHGLEAANLERHRNRGPLAEEELVALVEAGRSVREIATELDRSTATVRHWLKRYGLRTRLASRQDARADVARGDRFLAHCRRHGEAVFTVRADGGSSCLRCRVDAVTARRKRVKATLVAEAGGACLLCGYSKSSAALHFHHLDRATKEFNLGLGGVARSLARARLEARKCVLLCANCHAEVEAGDSDIPANILDSAADHPR